MNISWSTHENSDIAFFGFYLHAFDNSGSSGTMSILFWKWLFEFDMKYSQGWGHSFWKNKGWYYTDCFIPLPLWRDLTGKWFGGIYLSFRLRLPYRKINPKNIKRVKEYALYKHGDQMYGAYPYSYHLDTVYSVLKGYGVTDTTLLCSAWLHDVLEDTHTFFDEIKDVFNLDVANIVYAVTNGEGDNRKSRVSSTYLKIRHNKKGSLLKLADRISNMLACLDPKESSTNYNQLQKYLREYPEFKSGIYNSEFEDDLYLRMWQDLAKLVSEGEEILFNMTQDML